MRLKLKQPRSCATSTPGAAKRARSPASGETGGCGVTRALPPPWITVASAFGPITAIVFASTSTGSTASAFLSNTKLSAAARRQIARSIGSSMQTSSGRSSSRRPVRSINPSTRSALSSTTFSDTSPERTAAASFSPKNCGGPGISRSSPARAAGTVLCRPNQSDMTRPSNPHSSRSNAISSACSLQYGPLTRLYAVISAHTPASFTAASNGTSEISRNVRSSTSELIVMRSNSESLATKCFTVHPTPCDCTPVMYATAIRADRNGSSE